MPPDTAVAVREDQHPIIAKIDAKMPEIAAMLPEGMSSDRFRRVVVQALVRNPDLWACTPVSVVSAIVESAQIGLEPTGVLGRAWMLPYTVKGTKEAKLIVGYRGYSELAWRADRILVTTGAVRTGDHFEYRRGTGKYLHHVPASDDPEREADDANITDFWAMYTLPDGREDFDVMSRKGAERIRDKARYRNPVWDSDFAEMGRKTVLRRLLKVAPLSPEVQRVLARDEEIDFDTPVERVADPKRDELRGRIAERTAAIRGEPITSGGSEGAEMDNGAGVPASQPVEDAPTSSAGGSPAGDPWMRRLHAVGAERGYDHDALHDWACNAAKVESLADLTPKQRGEFMAAVERQPLIGDDSCSHPAHAHRTTDTGVECAECGATIASRIDTPSPGAQPALAGSGSATDREESVAPHGPAPTGQAGEAGSPSGSRPAPTLEDVLEAAGPGAEEVPPLPDEDPEAYRVWYDAQPAEKRALLRSQGRAPKKAVKA